MSNYKPAIFQPTVRPDWGGTLDYLSDEEKSQILTAIIKYPSVECNSKFWLGTIKPDLDLQLEIFMRSNAVKSRGALSRWGKTPKTEDKDMVSISIPSGNHLKEKEKGNNTDILDREESLDIYTTRTRAHESMEQIINKTAINISMHKRPGSIQITPDFVFPHNEYFDIYRQELPEATARVEQWIRKSQMVGKYITQQALGKIIRKFAFK